MMETDVKRMPIGVEMNFAEAPSVIAVQPSASELPVSFEFWITGDYFNELGECGAHQRLVCIVNMRCST
jgi:hypothetical protein